MSGNSTGEGAPVFPLPPNDEFGVSRYGNLRLGYLLQSRRSVVDVAGYGHRSVSTPVLCFCPLICLFFGSNSGSSSQRFPRNAPEVEEDEAEGTIKVTVRPSMEAEGEASVGTPGRAGLCATFKTREGCLSRLQLLPPPGADGGNAIDLLGSMEDDIDAVESTNRDTTGAGKVILLMMQALFWCSGREGGVSSQ